MSRRAEAFPPRVPSRGLRGDLPELMAAPHDFMAGTAERHGGIAAFRLFHRMVVVVSDAVLIEQVLVADAARYTKGRHYTNLEMLIGRGLVSLPDGPWQEHRRVIQPGFHRTAMTHLADVVASAVERRLAPWSAAATADRPFPVVPEMRAVSEQVISEVLLGTPVEEMLSARVAERYEEGLRHLAIKNWSPVPWPAWVPTRANRVIAARRRELFAFLEQRMDARLAAGVGTYGDLLDLLLLAHVDPADGRAPFAREDVVGEMGTLYSAGYETTAATLSWALYFVAKHPKIQARLHEEAVRVLGARPPAWDDIQALVYAGQIVNETLRLRPAIHTIARVATAAVSLGAYRIPAGTTVMLSFYGVHRSPRYWGDPERFDPDRFAAAADPPWPRHAFMPFSIGQHRCIGASLAVAEAVLVLAQLGRRFAFALPPGTAEVQPVTGMTHYPRPFHLHVTPRVAA
jgi:cytochrome P450